MIKKVYFITGGARSGKSSFAEKLANDFSGKRAYLATAQALDEEMSAKIGKHKQDRGRSWDTVEEPIAVAELLKKLNAAYDVVLLDCLTLWLSNLLAHSEDDAVVPDHFDDIVHAIREFTGTCIIVSNEVGLGIVPDNPVARRFRDFAGMLNQKVAQAADEVYVMISGIPVRIK